MSPPYQDLSLTSDLIWHFDDTNPAHYDLFDVRYVVAPTAQAMARFLKPLKVTARYTLYEAATGGYGAFVSLSRAAKVRQPDNLFFLNRDWFVGLQPDGGGFVRLNSVIKRVIGEKGRHVGAHVSWYKMRSSI